jgi:hypothetical protein
MCQLRKLSTLLDQNTVCAKPIAAPPGKPVALAISSGDSGAALGGKLAIRFRRSRCIVLPMGKNGLARHPILIISSDDEASLKSSAKNVAEPLKSIAPENFAAQ